MRQGKYFVYAATREQIASILFSKLIRWKQGARFRAATTWSVSFKRLSVFLCGLSLLTSMTVIAHVWEFGPGIYLHQGQTFDRCATNVSLRAEREGVASYWNVHIFFSFSSDVGYTTDAESKYP